MTTTRRTLLRATAGFAVASPAILRPEVLRAQPAWPAKPITIVVNFPAGGLTDGIARSFGQSVQQATGQQVIIDNKPGASGNIGAALVARAPADGYTFLHSVSSTLVQNRVMFKSMGFDPDKDLTIISGTSSGVLPVVVHKSVPVSNLKEFIEYAKTNKVNFGSWALGSSAHIFAQGLNEKFGLKMEVVTYKGEAPMWQDMGAGSAAGRDGQPAGLQRAAGQGRDQADRGALPRARRQVPRSADLDRAGLHRRCVRGARLAGAGRTRGDAQADRARRCPTSGSPPPIPSPAAR